jgi:hypothetical protein
MIDRQPVMEAGGIAIKTLLERHSHNHNYDK